MVSVVVADDHKELREHIEEMLSAEPFIDTVNAAGSGSEAIKVVRELKPEILILDLELGDMSGFDVAAYTRKESPFTKIIIFSIKEGEKYVKRAREIGARAYIGKGRPRELIRAVSEVADGRMYFPETQ